MTFFTEILELPSFVTSPYPQFDLSHVLKLCWSRHNLFHRNTNPQFGLSHVLKLCWSRHSWWKRVDQNNP